MRQLYSNTVLLQACAVEKPIGAPYDQRIKRWTRVTHALSMYRSVSFPRGIGGKKETLEKHVMSLIKAKAASVIEDQHKTGVNDEVFDEAYFRLDDKVQQGIETNVAEAKLTEEGRKSEAERELSMRQIAEADRDATQRRGLSEGRYHGYTSTNLKFKLD